MRLKILFIGHSYHKVTKSSEFFIDCLKSIGEVTIEFDDCVKGKLDRDYSSRIGSYNMVVVWQLHQVIRQLVGAKHKNLIYVPMYDAVFKQKSSFWKELSHVKIVCFSAALRAICLTHRLDAYFIQYYPDGAVFSPVGYENKKMFFWQRRSWPNWQTLTSILPACQFDKIHHHLAIDPGYESADGSCITPTASEICQANFSCSEWFPEKRDMIAKLKEFNLFFLPREREGIGFSFLDAMANGLVPVGFDQPTFNEYVIHGINGVIVDKTMRLDLPELSTMAVKMRHYLCKGRAIYERQLRELPDFLLKKVTQPPNTNSLMYRLAPKYMRRLDSRKRMSITASRRRYEGQIPLVSVILLMKDDAAGFAKTHQSICSQTSRDFEYLVIDGGSDNMTLDLLRRHEEAIDFQIGSSDSDSYKAMIKGATSARGRYVLFLNSGDAFADESSLDDALKDAPSDADILYGHHYVIKETHFAELVLTPNLESIYQTILEGRFTNSWLRGVPPFQAILIRRELILKYGFDPDLKELADMALLFEVCSREARTYHFNTVITRCHNRVISKKTEELWLMEWQQVLLKYCPLPDKVTKFVSSMKC